MAVTPAAVRDAATTLFAEKGYHGTALSEVAAHLGIRTPSLYNHMRSKQELLAEIVLDTSQQVWAEFGAAVDGRADVVDRLREAARVYALRHATHRREALIVNRDVASLAEPVLSQVLDLRRRHERAVRALIAEGVAQGRLAAEDPRTASFGLLEMCVSVARWFSPDGALSAQDVAEQYSDFALRVAGLRDPD
ncbi:TetR/AcrR family transcriptional regulator [Actinomycetospora chlora]|uniref:TetR/AcrR family transcriptional regulator n=1 Tax=Actinomycetospora chlora TaxID=663608 RepID=A0ABP9AKS3_9PSEU